MIRVRGVYRNVPGRLWRHSTGQASRGNLENPVILYCKVMQAELPPSSPMDGPGLIVQTSPRCRTGMQVGDCTGTRLSLLFVVGYRVESLCRKAGFGFVRTRGIAGCLTDGIRYLLLTCALPQGLSLSRKPRVTTRSHSHSAYGLLD